jgi:polysaccharide export outer membrane protein
MTLVVSIAVGLAMLTAPQSGGDLVGLPRLDPDYVVGADDILRILVSGHDDLTQMVLVQADGSFICSLIGRVEAGGRSIREVESDIRTRLAREYVRDPQVTVIVAEYRSKTVFVLGELATPGSYPLAESPTLVQLLARAGPVSAVAADEAIIVRPRDPARGPLLPSEVAAATDELEAEVIHVDLHALLSGNVSLNVQLRPNDTVFIPEAPKVYVSGEVRSAGAFPYSSGMTVRQAVSLAGGLNEYGSDGRMQIVREIDGESRKINVDLEDRVEPGDSVIVRGKLF